MINKNAQKRGIIDSISETFSPVGNWREGNSTVKKYMDLIRFHDKKARSIALGKSQEGVAPEGPASDLSLEEILSQAKSDFNKKLYPDSGLKLDLFNAKMTLVMTELLRIKEIENTEAIREFIERELKRTPRHFSKREDLEAREQEGQKALEERYLRNVSSSVSNINENIKLYANKCNLINFKVKPYKKTINILNRSVYANQRTYGLLLKTNMLFKLAQEKSEEVSGKPQPKTILQSIQNFLGSLFVSEEKEILNNYLQKISSQNLEDFKKATSLNINFAESMLSFIKNNFDQLSKFRNSRDYQNYFNLITTMYEGYSKYHSAFKEYYSKYLEKLSLYLSHAAEASNVEPPHKATIDLEIEINESSNETFDDSVTQKMTNTNKDTGTLPRPPNNNWRTVKIPELKTMVNHWALYSTPNSENKTVLVLETNPEGKLGTIKVKDNEGEKIINLDHLIKLSKFKLNESISEVNNPINQGVAMSVKLEENDPTYNITKSNGESFQLKESEMEKSSSKFYEMPKNDTELITELKYDEDNKNDKFEPKETNPTLHAIIWDLIKKPEIHSTIIENLETAQSNNDLSELTNTLDMLREKNVNLPLGVIEYMVESKLINDKYSDIISKIKELYMK